MTKPRQNLLRNMRRHMYVVVCKGVPDFPIQHFYWEETGALVAAINAVGSGTCTASRIMQCISKTVAKSASYDRVREKYEIVVIEFDEPLQR